MPRWMTISALLLSVLVPASASAADTWTDPAPGIRQLVRTAPGPIRYVAVEIDFARPDLYLRVTRPEERAQRTTAWANQVGAVVAINGDWSDGSEPVGLSVGDGQHWPGTADNAWSFMACTLEKECIFDDHTTNQERNQRWREVVGGNGWRLLIDGLVPTYPNEAFYNSDRHPRSGVGLSADGSKMFFAVAEGRRSASIGVTFPEMAEFMKSLGAHQAMMTDGGGSSTLTVNGQRQNNLPSNQSVERVVANHIAIIRGSASPECAQVTNGRYCDGNVVHTCQGSEYKGAGDCAAFGATCEVTSDGVGTCVHPDCTAGANGNFCENETEITSCEYGFPAGTGDCAAFGATCETGEQNAYCVHFECTEGGNASWCRDDGTVATCVDGQPVDDVACSAGSVCQQGVCVDPETQEPVEQPEQPGEPGEPGEPETNNQTPGQDTNETPVNDPGQSNESDMMGPSDSVEGTGGCSSVAAEPSPVWLLLLGLLGAGRRRR